MEREYAVLQPTTADIRARLVGLEEQLIQRAIAKGIIRTRDEARIRMLNATDLGKANREFSHTFSSAHAWEKYVDGASVTVGDMVIAIVGLENLSADPKLISLRFSTGVPLRPVLTVDVDAMLVQEEQKVLFTEDVVYEKGDKPTIEVYGTGTGAERFVLLGLVCEKA